MADINLSIKHGKTQQEARALLEQAVNEIGQRFAALVRRVEWTPDRNKVHVSGQGFEMDAWVDALEVHLLGDIPLLGRLFGAPLAATLKEIVHQTFHKQLT